MPVNRSMPSGVVIPVLAYPDVGEAVDWLCRSFGFVERLRIGNHRAQLSVGEGAMVVTEQQSRPGAQSAEESATEHSPPSGAGHSVMVRVTDLDKHYQRAREHGARIVNPPTEYPYGERQYSAQDPAGHLWTFSQTIADVDPAAWGGVLTE